MAKQLPVRIEIEMVNGQEQEWANLGQGHLAHAVITHLGITRGGAKATNAAGDLLYYNGACTGDQARELYQALVDEAVA